MLNKIKNIFKTIVLMSLIIGASCTKKNAEPEKYYILKGYTGKLYIIFDAHNGVEPKYESSTRIYNFNASGVLVTKFKSNEGYHQNIKKDVQFYMVGENDTVLIPVIYDALNLSAESNDSQIHVFEIHNGNYNHYHYKSFFVDTLANGKKYPDENFVEDPQKMETIFKQNKIIK